MSDAQGLSPARLHELLGDSDWRVTSRGAEALYRGVSLAEVAQLVPHVVAAAEASGVAPDVDLRPAAVAVRVGFAGDMLPAGVVQFARAVSAAAATLRADPGAIQTVDIFVAQHEEADTRPFWAAVLGYVERGATDAVDPLGRGPGIAVNPIGNGKRGRGRTHIDVHMSAETARARVDAALAAGGRLVDDSYAPAWWTLASPENHGVDIATWVDTWDGS
jgi:hypothetical protein